MWVLLAVLCGFAVASTDALVKTALRSHSALPVAWARYALAAPFLLTVLPAGAPPDAPLAFALTLLAAAPVEILALVLYTKAIQKSPLSLCAPFLAFTPAFVLVTGWVTLAERPDAAGAAGVLLVCAGAYTLSMRPETPGILAPFRNFAREPGSVYMALVAVLYSVTSVLGKRLVLLSSPLFTASVYLFAVSLLFAPVVAYRHGPGVFRQIFASRLLWAAGAGSTVMYVLHNFAVSMAPVAHMIAVKRVSLLFGVLYGVVVFKEGGARNRVPGAVLMLLGVGVLGFRG
jgi:drug/metabolite transporter (DMT)-like permease